MSVRLSHVIVVLLVFILIGPLLGLLSLGVLLDIFSAGENLQHGASFVLASLAFLPLAYVMGGAQALVTGIVTAWRVWQHGNCPLWVPLLAAFVSGVVMQIRNFEDMAMAIAIILIHLSAAAGCWLMLYYALDWNKAASQGKTVSS